MQKNTTGREAWKGCIDLPLLRVREVFCASQLRRLTATTLSGLVLLGVFSPIISGSSAVASSRKKNRSHSSHRSESSRRSSARSARAAHVKVDTAILRSGPDRKSKATALLDAGRKARVLERRDGWMRLRLASGTEGWVRADLLKVSKKRVTVSEVEEGRSSERTRKKYAAKVEKASRRKVAVKSVKPVRAAKTTHIASKGVKSAKPASKPVARTTATTTVASLPPDVIAAARKPFVRSINLRPVTPPSVTTIPGSATETIAASENTVEEVTVESDLPPEMLQPEPVSGAVMEAENAVAEAEIPDVVEAVTPTPVSTARNERIVRSALAYRGARYRLGSTGRYGAFDCSGFTRHVLGKNGASLPRTASEQYHAGAPVSRANLQAGDLVFFKNTYKHGISHVGIYIGNDRFIHASSRRTGVTVSDLSSSYYARHYAGARRVR